MHNSYEQYLARVLIDGETLQARIAELGTQISADYADKDELILVCVLKGGIVFLCDLIRQIETPHSVEFMAVTSYGVGARETSGNVRILMDLSVDIQGKHILIVEDIIDSGNTLAYIVRQLEARQPASLKVCTLLSKPSRRQVEVPIEYLGFEIPNEFVFGYGLDLDEKFRNVPFIGVVNLDVYQPPKSAEPDPDADDLE